MKIRTDFVTNSSSSGFCVVTVVVQLKDGHPMLWVSDECEYEGRLFFDKPQMERDLGIPQIFETFQTGSDLSAFLAKAIGYFACEDLSLDLSLELLQIDQLDDIESFEISSRAVDTCEAPGEVVEATMTYSFKDKSYNYDEGCYVDEKECELLGFDYEAVCEELGYPLDGSEEDEDSDKEEIE